MSSVVSSIYFFVFCWSTLLSYGLATTATSVLRTNETDQLALLEFKAKITRDPLQVLSSWNDSSHFCQWKGVSCSRKHQRVIALLLPSLRLQGSLSPHIGNLSFLRFLNLQNNGFRDEIPPQIGHLFRLQFLSLENNSFGGQIPANISRCVNLQFLTLGNNELVGNVPEELGSLSKLSQLFIYFNDLSGEIPPSFGNLSSLEILSAAGNQFVGRIPATLGQLKRMYYISLGPNNLSGEIPPSIYNISSLVYFYFTSNQLQGSLPSDLGFTLPNLEVINVAENQFTGPIPASISNATNLMRLTLPLNRFSGKVPTMENLHKLRWVSISRNELGNGKEDDLEFLNSLVNASSLEILAINDNKFGGVLPEALGNLSTQLKVLALGDNQIFGRIPPGIRNCVNLEILLLKNNQFTGQIPSSIGNLQKLLELWLERNKFLGEIPSSLGNLTMLNKLSLERNMLQGSIPSSLGKCQSLILLDLSHNNLSGTIPGEVIGLSSLSIYLDLSQNQLNGSLPSNFGNLINLAALDISENQLSGEIPGSLGSCVRLQDLIMKGNFFQGKIPSSLSSLRGIQSLDLSRNNLSGQIPEFLENFRLLQNLNLSYNAFEGEVPIKGVFSNASAISFSGNANLCGGISDLHLSSCPMDESKQTRSPSLKLIIPIVVGILLLTMILCLMTFYSWRKAKSKKGASLYISIDQTVVAVKVLNLQHRGASKSFMAECEALRSIRHRNLVKIITACASVDLQGNDFKALVYEFMGKGSLEEWLHPNNPGADELPEKLNLLQRLNVAIDVACALDYLHHHCETPIVHCDLKPSNVLLNDEMIGHVGDFGLAKFLVESTNNSSTGQTSSIGVRGTVGYAAPEYGMGSEVSTEGDVYSYGILLLEMFTGKRPTDEMFTGNLNLHNFVKEALPEKLTEIVDPVLLVEIEEGETSQANGQNVRRTENNFSFSEALVSILGNGVTCSSELPRERMNMEEVVAQLLSIRNKLLQTRTSGGRQATIVHSVQQATNVTV
ncbi:putative Receptor-kinase [Melia azedarach]|uniref:Receptor-kinase n=1 Tax=Melia azedarach TaxID=155640 RepID=A0ACC1Y8F4_MELAZ|nr:putative Receptor-kinase [Melia azedarach]